MQLGLSRGGEQGSAYVRVPWSSAVSSEFFPIPVLSQRLYLLSALGAAHLSCSTHFSNPLAMMGLLWVRLRPGTSLSPLAQGREVWQKHRDRREGKSTSGATALLSQEPVSPNLAFALHLYIPSKLQLKTTKLLQDSLGLRRQVDLQGFPVGLHP